MALSRSGILVIAGATLTAASVASIGYRVWVDFYAPAAPPASAQAAARPPSAQPAARPPSAQPRGDAPPTTVLKSPAAASVAALKTPRAVVSAAAPPAFDIVRVEPSGDSVVAGRASAGARVALLDNGSEVDRTTADGGGQFAMTPPTLLAGNHELSLKATRDGRDVASPQSVTVLVPKEKGGRLIVALVAPGQPTRLLDSEGPKGSDAGAGGGVAQSLATASAGAAGVPDDNGKIAHKASGKPQVFVQTVEAGQGGGFFATGSAAPGSSLRLYLNNSPVAQVTADARGRWSLRVKKGLRPGSYSFRADEVDPKSGRVAARAEAPFDFTGFADADGAKGGASSLPVSRSEPGAEEGDEANATVADLPTVRVFHGDNLWRISRKIFGQGIRYTLIYEANASQIRDRDLIYPGQIFVVPKT